ncbi:aminoacyl-tRNA hydrolase [Peptoniphilus sp. GNH]|nr:aminoacyl-tRNA hydrolase [Peptoniphilus sp. GNH]
MYLIVGLGNPGSQYEFTRHNVGFLTIDYMAEKLGQKVNKLKFKGLYCKFKYADEDIILLKPQTYMNLSGESVRDFANFFKIPPEKIIIVVDDVDLDLGRIRFKKSGSAGTHNGLKSIIYQLQSQDFPRLKIGIERENRKDDLADFVLKGFSKDEVPLIEKSIEDGVDGILHMIGSGIDSAMNKYNKRAQK